LHDHGQFRVLHTANNEDSRIAALWCDPTIVDIIETGISQKIPAVGKFCGTNWNLAASDVA
jgi:hypothetical protein